MYSLLIVNYFLGSGNIGDDLMMIGLSRALAESKHANSIRVTAFCRPFTNHHIASQRLRIPQWRWYFSDLEHVLTLAPRHDLCAIVGDTPFQDSSSHWHLDNCAALFPRIHALGGHTAMIAIGTEDLKPAAVEKAKQFLPFVDYISVRSEFDKQRLLKWGYTGPLDVTSDLAYLAHTAIPEALELADKDGFVLVSERHSPYVFWKALLALLVSSSKQLVPISNEWQKEPRREIDVYQRLVRPIRWLTFRRRITSLRVMDYPRGTIEDWLRVYRECDVLLTARYHALVLGALVGCRLVAIERSTKLADEAKLLGAPCLPVTAGLHEWFHAIRSAPRVEPHILEARRNDARGGVDRLIHWLISISESTR